MPEIVDAAFVVVALTPPQAATAANVSRTRIFEAIRAGELVARKAGKSTLIEVSELRRWVQNLPVRTARCAAQS